MVGSMLKLSHTDIEPTACAKSRAAAPGAGVLTP